MSARESYPVPSASAAQYAGYIWRLGLHEGAVQFPSEADAHEPDENSAVSEYLSTLVGQSAEQVVHDLRDTTASALGSGLLELGMPAKKLTGAHAAEVIRVHGYMVGPVHRTGRIIAHKQLLIDRDFIETVENPFSSPELFEAIWRFRDDRRHTAGLKLQSFLGPEEK